MPFRISIPLPGPVSWSPSRRKRGSGVSPEQMQRVADGIEAAAQRHLEKHEETYKRLGENVLRREEEMNQRYDEGMAELEQIKKLPPVARFRAAMRFRP